MRLTKFNPETGQYVIIETPKTFSQLMAQRKAVIQRLGEYEDKSTEVAEEIFGEIEEGINKEKAFCEKGVETSHEKWMIRFWEGGAEALSRLVYFIAELKKKYTEGGE